MPYFTGDSPIGPNADSVTLDDFPSSQGLSVVTAAQNAWAGNPSTMAVDWLRFKAANSGVKVAKADAEAQVKQAGVKITVPDESYTADALAMLIKRQQDNARRADILSRAPTGFMPSTARFTAELAAGIADPLNVAAGFVPVLGEARVAQMMARAGDSFLARSGARASIGAIEGGTSIAAIEPLNYGAHQQLQDDYTMADSLMNIGFGSLLGAGLHVGGGALSDMLRGGAAHPAARYAGMGLDDIQHVLDFERERATMTPADQARVLESFSPEARRALGVTGDVHAPVHEEGEPYKPAISTPESPMSAASIAARISPEIHETAMRQAIADLASGRMPDVENIVRMDPQAQPSGMAAHLDSLIAELQDQRAELLGDTSGLAEKGVIRETRAALKEHMRNAPEVNDTTLRERAKEIQAGERISYKAALSKATKESENLLADHAATAQRLQQIIDANAKAQHAIQTIHERDLQIAELQRQRAKLPETQEPATLDHVRATSEAQATPERVSVADFFAARAAEQRLKDAPKADVPGQTTHAQDEATKATQRLADVIQNLKDGGMSTDQLQAALDAMKPFEEAVNDAQKMGDAVRAAALCGVRS